MGEDTPFSFLKNYFLGKEKFNFSFGYIWETTEEFRNRRKNDGKGKYREQRRKRNRAASRSRARNRQ
jgi:hypothetical protein